MITAEAIVRRNERLVKFFKYHFEDDVKIIGSPDMPTMIHKNKIVLSCFVKNFNLYFTDAAFNGNIIYEVKLTSTAVGDKDRIQQWFEDTQHRSYFTIGIDTLPELKLAGYTFADKGDISTKVPVFSTINEKIYFSPVKAQAVVNRFSNATMKLRVM